MGRESSEFKQLVLLQSLGKVDVVEVVEGVDRVAQSLVILLLDEQIVVCVVDGFDVELEARSVTDPQVCTKHI